MDLRPFLNLFKQTRLGAIGGALFLLGVNAGTPAKDFEQPFRFLIEILGTMSVGLGIIFLILAACGVEVLRKTPADRKRSPKPQTK
jgi:hypothetical protein